MDPELVRMAHDLQAASDALRERGLLVAANWAIELFSSLPEHIQATPNIPFSPPPQPPELPASTSHAFSPTSKTRPSIGEFIPSPGPGAFGYTGELRLASGGDPRLALGSVAEHDGEAVSGAEAAKRIADEGDEADRRRYKLARSYFDMREYDRVILKSKGVKGTKAKFLRIYCQYLSIDRKVQGSLTHFMALQEERNTLFSELNPLLQQLLNDTDPYLVYLRGVLYMRIGQNVAAIECFVQSVLEQPYNWSAWSQMAQLIKSTDMWISIRDRLPDTPLRTLCAITVMLDLHTATERVMSMIEDLLLIFPSSVHLRAQRAVAYYHMRDFETAERHFDAVRALDPCRLEEVDIYSNMLYVMDKQAKLSHITHEYSGIDPHRAEICCLQGNYYSSRGDHTKALKSFKKAVLLNREYLPAWTLLGHEWVELKNSNAAIEAYRKAIDINAKDYRAWYGLGQTYELLDMPHYAIDYYQQATALRPYDCRMWTALATVYEAQGDLPNSIKSHERAIQGADRAQMVGILAKLASLHHSLAADYLSSADARANSGGGIGRGRSTEPPPMEAEEKDERAKAVEHGGKSAGWHQQLIALGEADGLGVGELAGSYVAVAEWEMRHAVDRMNGASASSHTMDRGLGSSRGKRTGRSKSPEKDKDKDEGKEPEGDLALASLYLEKVKGTTVPQSDKAQELYRQLKLLEARLAVGL